VLKRQETRPRISTICLLFTLMFAVFAFGLNARIQSVRTGASTTSAKLSIEKRSPAAVVATTVETDPPVPLLALHMLLTRLASQLPSQEVMRSLHVEWSLRKTSNLDSQGPSLMLRPPPFHP
jgi:hypothetical protein